MVDTLVETVVLPQLSDLTGLWGPYWSDESTGVIIFIDTGLDVSAARTTDKGASWTTIEISNVAAQCMACWYDKETPGNDGTLIHIGYLDSTGSDFAYYITFDVATGSVGTRRTVDSAVTVSTVRQFNRLAITQTVSGNIIYAFSTQTEIECYKSADNFATAGTSIADPFETTTEEDWLLLFPAATADDDDAVGIFWDRSADEISIKMWDSSAGTWTETSISGSMVDDFDHINMDASVRHSDSHVLLAAHSNDDNAGDDLRTWDLTVDSIGSPTITAKTNVFTDVGESAQTAVFINQQNDDVYIAYIGGTTWQSLSDVFYRKSVDGMGSWAGESSYSEDTPDDLRLVQAGRTVGNAGGRYQPAFFNDDIDDIYVNENNDIEFAPVPEAQVSGEQPNPTGTLSAVVVVELERISLEGSYTPVVALEGSNTPAITGDGSETPVVELEGQV